MRRTFAALTALAVFALTGCGGGGGITVTGNVIKDGKPFPGGEQNGLNVTLTQDGGTATGSGAVDAEGKFKITAVEGAGLPPGKYKVKITHYTKPAKERDPSVPIHGDLPDMWDVGATTTFTVDLDKLPKESKPK